MQRSRLMYCLYIIQELCLSTKDFPILRDLRTYCTSAAPNYHTDSGLSFECTFRPGALEIAPMQLFVHSTQISFSFQHLHTLSFVTVRLAESGEVLANNETITHTSNLKTGPKLLRHVIHNIFFFFFFVQGMCLLR